MDSGERARLWDTAVELYRHMPGEGAYIWEEEGRLRDFYANGVDKIVFRKLFRGDAPGS